MHEKGIILINKAMKSKRIIGLDKSCNYLPCHQGLEDCTFCYCPFYSCNKDDTGGFEKISFKTGKPVWACSACTFPHKKKNAEKILRGLIKLGADFNSIPREKLMGLRSKILRSEGG